MIDRQYLPIKLLLLSAMCHETLHGMTIYDERHHSAKHAREKAINYPTQEHTPSLLRSPDQPGTLMPASISNGQLHFTQKAHEH